MPALSTFGGMSARAYGVSQSGIIETVNVEWVQRLQNGWWASAAISGDGTTMFAGKIAGNVFRSLDGGETFETTVLPSSNWITIGTGYNGATVLAANQNGQLRISRDYGVTWTAILANGTFYYGVCISDDNQTLVACSSRIFVSNNNGGAWRAVGSTLSYRGCAMSADGSFIVATAEAGVIQISNDSGKTFANSGSGSKSWVDAACSDDGSVAAAACNATLASGGGLWVTRDRGITWQQVLKAPNLNSVSMSADGERTVVGDTKGNFYHLSGNFTVLKTTNFINGAWNRSVVSMSSDSKKIIAVASSGATSGVLATSIDTTA